MLIEERQQAHQYRWNTNKIPYSFKVGDIVKSRFQVHSNVQNLVVHKLSYQAQGKF